MNCWLQCELPWNCAGVVLFSARVQGAAGQALPADIGAPGGPGVLSLPTFWRGPVLCHGPPRHRGGGGCGAVTAHQMPVAAWPRTVKRSESWALSLGFMACVLGMQPTECFLSIHPSIHPPSNAPPPPQGASGQQLVGGVVGVQNRGVAPSVAKGKCEGVRTPNEPGFGAFQLRRLGRRLTRLQPMFVQVPTVFEYNSLCPSENSAFCQCSCPRNLSQICFAASQFMRIQFGFSRVLGNGGSGFGDQFAPMPSSCLPSSPPTTGRCCWHQPQRRQSV